MSGTGFPLSRATVVLLLQDPLSTKGTLLWSDGHGEEACWAGKHCGSRAGVCRAEWSVVLRASGACRRSAAGEGAGWSTERSADESRAAERGAPYRRLGHSAHPG
ncbi:unnamed protein product [Lampetra fluviatilis]